MNHMMMLGRSAPIWHKISGAFAAWRADMGVTLVDRNVSVWTSQVSSGGTVAQSTPANRPTFNASNALMNGLPAITFDGTATFLQSSLAVTAWRFLHDGTGCSFFCVSRPDSASGTRSVFTSKNAGANPAGIALAHLPASNRFQYYIANGTGTVINISTGAGAPENTSIYGALCTFSTAASPDAVLRHPANTVIGSSDVVDVPSVGNPSSTLRIGATGDSANFFSGPIAELVIWPFALSSEQITLVQDYAQRRYASS